MLFLKRVNIYIVCNVDEGLVEILRVEVVLLIGGHWPPIKLIDLIKMQIS